MTDSDQKFIQTASETIFYYWLKQKFSKIQIDQKINPAKESRVAKCVDLDDNKLLSCIQKAQGKFIKSGDDTINILLIAGDTQRLYHFMDYLTRKRNMNIPPQVAHSFRTD